MEIEQGRFGCPECPDRFKTVGDKRRHIRAEHTDEQDLESLPLDERVRNGL